MFKGKLKDNPAPQPTPAPKSPPSLDDMITTINQNPGHDWILVMVNSDGSNSKFEIDGVLKAYRGSFFHNSFTRKPGVVFEQANGKKYVAYHLSSIQYLR